MKVVKDGVGTKYEPKMHSGCYSMYKLEPGKDTRRTAVNLSHFLPDGGAEMSASPKERVYLVIGGTVQVIGKNEKYDLEPGDVIYIAPGEERAMKVTGTEPATLFVIITDV